MPDLSDASQLGYAALGVAGGILLTAGGIAWKLAPLARRITHFLDDWQGEDARPGIPRRPGVLERLQTQEVASAVSSAALGILTSHVAPLTPDGGTAMRTAMADATTAARRRTSTT